MDGRAFQIVLVRPRNFVYIESWREAIDAMRHGFAALGIHVPVHENRVEPGATPILFGAHHLQAGQEQQLPDDSVLYNLEQLRPGYPWYSERYLSLLGKFRVWDFHKQNVVFLRESGINRTACHVPIGYVPQLTTIASPALDIDVLFYGVMTERRQEILQALNKRGLNVIALRGVFGAQRDSWIARAKVVLNLHQEADGFFETLRVLHLMANAKAVVTECNDTAEIDDHLLPGLCAVPYHALVDKCAWLAKHDAERRALEVAAQAAVRHPELAMNATLRRVALV